MPEEEVTRMEGPCPGTEWVRGPKWTASFSYPDAGAMLFANTDEAVGWLYRHGCLTDYIVGRIVVSKMGRQRSKVVVTRGRFFLAKA